MIAEGLDLESSFSCCRLNFSREVKVSEGFQFSLGCFDAAVK